MTFGGSSDPEATPVAGSLSPGIRLTRRENELFLQLATGRNVAEAAEHLQISRSTADKHRGRVFRRLGVASLPAALAQLRPVLRLPLLGIGSDASLPTAVESRLGCKTTWFLDLEQMQDADVRAPAAVLVELEAIRSAGDVLDLARRGFRVAVIRKANDDLGAVLQALAEGAHAYLALESPDFDRITSLEAGSQHQAMLDPTIATIVLNEWRRTRNEDSSDGPVASDVPGHLLTPRELQIIKRMRDGLSVKQIAADLGTSPRTVENQRTRIYAKLGVKSAAQALMKVRTDDDAGDEQCG